MSEKNAKRINLLLEGNKIENYQRASINVSVHETVNLSPRFTLLLLLQSSVSGLYVLDKERGEINALRKKPLEREYMGSQLKSSNNDSDFFRVVSISGDRYCSTEFFKNNILSLFEFLYDRPLLVR